jgi:hypothetical protein
VLQLQCDYLIACRDLIQNGWRYFHSMVARGITHSTKQHGSLEGNRHCREACGR